MLGLKERHRRRTKAAAMPICPSSLIGRLNSVRDIARVCAYGQAIELEADKERGGRRGALKRKNRPIYTQNIPGSARNARNPLLALSLHLPPPPPQFLTRVMSFSQKTLSRMNAFHAGGGGPALQG